MTKFRMHVVGLPHTQVTKDYLSCAYTQKVLNFCKMMTSLGHKIFLYASEETDAPVTELITCITKKEQEQYFGGVDTKKDFYPISWSNEPYWRLMNGRVIEEIKKRIEPQDFICLIGGTCQQKIALAFSNHIVVEFGIGYQGIFADYKVFESYAWMNYVYGFQVGIAGTPPPGKNKRYENGQAYDIVIPNYFDISDFPKIYNKEDYYLYIGRFISRKGADIAAELCERMGKQLIMCGQGVIEQKNGEIIGTDMIIKRKGVKHIGSVGKEQRAELMDKAKAVLVPTLYIEPFAGVHIEAMLAGTPVITTDWGVFPETVINGFNGYRCRTMGEMMQAMKDVETLDGKKIREYAIANYGLDRIAQQYQAYFEQLSTLWKEGWYSEENFKEYKRYERIWPITE